MPLAKLRKCSRRNTLKLFDNKKLIELLLKNDYQSIAIISHTSADPDSIASAFGMDFILKQLHPKVTVDILIDEIGLHVSNIIDYYKMPILNKANKNYDLFIIVDVNVLTQIGIFQDLILKQNKNSLLIIDHHTTSNFSKAINYTFIDEQKTSTSEIVTKLIFELALKPDVKLLNVLLAGIIYDSRRFLILNFEQLKLLEKMFNSGVDYKAAIKLIQLKKEDSERIAHIKCASRLFLNKIDSWLIVWSTVGSFEGSSAKAIVDLGADVAIIYSIQKNTTRLNIRATNDFYDKTGIHFGKDIMQALEKVFGGEGGGHSIAAALVIPEKINEEKLKKETFNLLQSKLKH